MARESSSIIPESVVEAVSRTASSMVELNSNFQQLLPDPDRAEPLERAQALLLLAKAATTVFAVRLRCRGVDTQEHPIQSEIERLSLYQEKLQRAIHLSKAPLRPSATVNAQAATRFIEHSLPDLTIEQKRSMREISRGAAPKLKHLDHTIHKKRKFQTTDKKSVKSAAQEFLEKAAKELLNDNKSGVPGPIQINDSDED